MKDLYDEWICPTKVLEDRVTAPPDSLNDSEQQAIDLFHKCRNQFLAALKSPSRKIT